MDAERPGGFARIVDLPDDDSREKEVYARYGLAMFHAHAFEHGLITLITASVTAEHDQAGTSGGADAFAELMNDLYSRTAGGLLSRLRKRPGLTLPLETMLREALEVRNRLAHRWFREMAINFGSVEGMQGMVDDLDQALETLRAASAQTYGLASQAFMALGVSERDIERIRGRLADLEQSGPS